MSTEELTMNGMDAIGVASARMRIHTKEKSGASVKERCATALRAAAASVTTLAGAASFAFGFVLLAGRQKDLGYIDVLIALAVTAGTAIAACGIAALVRTIRDGRTSAVKARGKA